MKRGETVMNYVLMLGLLVIGVIAFGVLKNLFTWQAVETGKEVRQAFFEDVLAAVERGMAYPSDSEQNLTFRNVERYELEIYDNILRLRFPGQMIEQTLVASSLNVIPNRIVTSGSIAVITRNGDLFVTDSLRCIHGDGICDPACIYDKDPAMRCDPDCYSEDGGDGCISACVDRNKDGLTNHLDTDAICDPDCYNGWRNGGTYDIDCITSGDGICDPDTHMKNDSYCDRDCLGPAPDFLADLSNGVCDTDCLQFDPDCPHLGNGICEPDLLESCLNKGECACLPGDVCRRGCSALATGPEGCISALDLHAKGSSCLDACECEQGLACAQGHCCAPDEYWDGACVRYADNPVCDHVFGEDCENNAACACTECCVGCLGASQAGCCPDGKISCTNLCADPSSVPEGQPCACDGQCISGDCAGFYGQQKMCCPDGMAWDGTACVQACDGACDTLEECALGCLACTLADCEGNGQCDVALEDCASSADCTCDQCCPGCPGALDTGCCPDGQISCDGRCIPAPSPLYQEGAACVCQEICAADLNCNTNTQGTAKNCCPENLQWDGIACFDNVKLRVVFIPVNWDSSMAAFDSAVSQQMAQIINNIPMKACPERAEAVPVHTNCVVDMDDCNTCSPLNQVEQCASASGEDFDYVIGLEDSDVCGGTLGFSCGTGTVFSESSYTLVSVHELGHEWGLNDEYVDACNCGFGLVDANANCLMPDLDGDNPVFPRQFQHCGGGLWPPDYQITCEGNKNIYQGRCIMSYGGAPGPNVFCRECNEHLATVGIVNC